MSKIQEYLTKIMNAVYGRDVRSAIHDSIEECYRDVSTAETLADAATKKANTAASNADAKATAANTATTQANAARDAANSAANNANTKAGLANTAAENANNKADAANKAAQAATTAKTEADTARDAANTAATKATEAASNANAKATAADTATTNANAATKKANDAATAATTAKTNAETATENANDAAAAATTATTQANAAKESATAAAGTANTAAQRAERAAEMVETGQIPPATADSYGSVKIYGTTGQNEDGPMTQKATTDALAGKAATGHSHNLPDLGGTLPLTKGGTGATEAGQARTNLGITLGNLGAAAASHKHALSDLNDSAATASKAGLTKLFGETGQGQDGAMTQKATTDALNKKVSTDDMNLINGASNTYITLNAKPNGDNKINLVNWSVQGDGDHKPWIRVTDKDGGDYAHFLYTNRNPPTAANVGALAAGGTAVAANKLATARQLKVNLANNSTVQTFDGTANRDLSVTGTLGIANGGTGATDAAGARNALGAVAKSGDTMTGNLKIEKSTLSALELRTTDAAQNPTAAVEVMSSGWASFGVYENRLPYTGRALSIYHAHNNSKATPLNDALQLEDFTSGTSTSYRVYHDGMTTPIPVAKGGTGATTADQARKNLGITASERHIECGQEIGVGTSGKTITFKKAFSRVPIVTATIANTEISGLRVKSVTTANFVIEANNSNRTVNWIAVEPDA